MFDGGKYLIVGVLIGKLNEEINEVGCSSVHDFQSWLKFRVHDVERFVCIGIHLLHHNDYLDIFCKTK